MASEAKAPRPQGNCPETNDNRQQREASPSAGPARAAAPVPQLAEAGPAPTSGRAHHSRLAGRLLRPAAVSLVGAVGPAALAGLHWWLGSR